MTAPANVHERGARRLGRPMRVLRTTEVTPLMRRITVGPTGGEGLPGADHEHRGPNVKVFIPRPGQTEPVMPHREDGRLVWPPEDVRATVRTYTVRRYDLEASEMDIDFVLHGDEGVASTWAANAEPGDIVGVGAPGGLTVREADWYLLAGDQTALPAISVILETLPETARGYAFVEVPDAREEQELVHPAGVELVWLHRGDAPAGTGTALADAARAVTIPDGSVFAWAGAESTTVRTLRRHWQEECGLERRRKLAIGYWKRGISETEYDHKHDHDRAEEDRYENQPH
ncbi:NADPH-dependent ferric siderophore reductase, contains FAD-binding and SIP domains [Streptoalloteichus tenebrarius]|uniref:NADPH-dependent ferric siderophore reductase, contains FAD-binding and SIP domains n=1 Tax=Streptoalloteichus tenebrarius (strain ATCC 17920 / DSM 40477 / JCM 4838 / CBS 697.72 / NBRC 16177 / NCIMB 11028 / NRRL B-12390 / A12253. 1 / ISP 5477) TaxID=1933 RepID=A0ABT1HWY2_STRSD|nr:siderophore-interacting protein [Streptoalloteichus tenebrarius]MCP2260042.1 NADPH-dependent ferric siderophore reductase, contains FAD-binding and SIP domains [Streptoalloteichus tenebrarius]BFF03839.1 siderophore-interacting protein [Streptoalloteichus tenebrarius]